MTRQEFLEKMSEAARHQTDRAYTNVGLWALATLVVIILGIALGLALYRRRHRILGRWIYLKKMWKGEAISKDRRRRQLDVVLQIPYDQKPFRTKTVNLSPRGFFIQMDPPLMVGESFRFLLVLDDANKVNALAEVRWAQESKTAFMPAGMGCKFYQVSESDERKILKYLRGV